MLGSGFLRSVSLSRARFQAYSTETAPPASSTPAGEGAEKKNEDEPLWNMQNPFEKTKRKCILCQNKIEVNYKNVQLLSQFVSNYTGQLYGKHITGLCENQQQKVARALRIAQSAGLVPIYHKDMRFIRDPKLFDPLHPQRPNPH